MQEIELSEKIRMAKIDCQLQKEQRSQPDVRFSQSATLGRVPVNYGGGSAETTAKSSGSRPPAHIQRSLHASAMPHSGFSQMMENQVPMHNIRSSMMRTPLGTSNTSQNATGQKRLTSQSHIDGQDAAAGPVNIEQFIK